MIYMFAATNITTDGKGIIFQGTFNKVKSRRSYAQILLAEGERTRFSKSHFVLIH